MKSSKFETLKKLANQFNDNGYIESNDFNDLEAMRWAVMQVEKTGIFKSKLDKIEHVALELENGRIDGFDFGARVLEVIGWD